MRIVIDMLGALAPAAASRGVGRYTREMAKEIIRQSKVSGDEVFLIVNPSFPKECDRVMREVQGLLPRENIKAIDFSDCPAAACFKDNAAGRPLQERIREWFLHQFDADVIWSTDLQQGWLDDNAVTSVKMTAGREIWCTTVHDVTPLLIFGQEMIYSPIRDWYFRKLEFAKNSDIIATDSEFSKQRLMDRLDVPEHKIVVAGCAVDTERFYVERPEWKNASSKDGSIFYAGGMDVHKNLYTLLEAYTKLDASLQRRHKMIFAGTAPDELVAQRLRAKAKVLGIPKGRIEILGRVDDKRLRELMGKCSVFVYPSTYEGFGLPPLEAMACGAPVLAADSSSLPEVVGNPEMMFDPQDARQLSEKLKRVLDDAAYAQKLIDFGLKRALEFSWRDSAKQLLATWRTAVSERRGKYPKYGIKNLARDLLYERFPPPVVEAAAKTVVKAELFRKKRRIFVDVSGVVLCNFCSGIQRVANALAINLEKLSNDSFEAVPVFSDAWNPNFYRARLNKGRYERSEVLPQNAVTFRDGDALLISDLHPGSITTKEGMLEGLCRCGVDVVTVVYDLIPIDLPETYPPEFVQGFAGYLKVIAKFSGILGISQFSEDRFVKWCKDEKISFHPYFRKSHFYLGSDILNAAPSKGLPEDAEETLKTLKSCPTFLAVSTIEPRKMHLQMLDAFDILWKRGVKANLVFVGRDGWENDSIKTRMNEHPENGKRFHWLQGVSDEYLERIYDASSCVIMASRCEGFGLSIVEGAQHGKPLILRDIPVFREVAGDNALYFKGTEGKDLAKAVEQWLALQKRGKVPSSKGIRGYTWRESAEAVLDFFGLKH